MEIITKELDMTRCIENLLNPVPMEMELEDFIKRLRLVRRTLAKRKKVCVAVGVPGPQGFATTRGVQVCSPLMRLAECPDKLCVLVVAMPPAG